MRQNPLNHTTSRDISKPTTRYTQNRKNRITEGGNHKTNTNRISYIKSKRSDIEREKNSWKQNKKTTRLKKSILEELWKKQEKS